MVAFPSIEADAGVPTDPNVVIVMADDMRWDSLIKPFSHDYMPTINDELVSKGIRFRYGMVPTSTCCPSRASTLTGLFAHSTKVWTTEAIHGGWQHFVAEGNEHRTLATALDEQGYETGLFGKYLNGYGSEGDPYRPEGWDAWSSFWQGANYFDYALTDGSTITVHGSEPAEYSTDVLAAEAVEFIRGAPTGSPIFLYYAPFGPHNPYTPPPRYDGQAGALPAFRPASYDEPDVSDKPRWVRRLPSLTVHQRAHLDETYRDQFEVLHAVDDGVADILAELGSTGRLANTLVVFMSDNGLMLGEHRLSQKYNPYEAATRIPMVIRWDAAGLDVGLDSEHLALNLDVAATIQAATGSDVGALEGEDLLAPPVRDGFVLEAWRKPGVDRPQYCGWRTKDALYVSYRNGDAEFYSYAADPNELRNAVDDPAFAPTIKAYRREAREACDPVPPGFHWVHR